MKTEEGWRDEYLEDIGRLKERGRKSLYRINEKLSRETVDYLQTYFEKNGYSFEKRRCVRCAGWDIIITWTL